MFKKVLTSALMFVATFTALAQMPQLSPLPLKPEVKTGQLPNGLTYYILHNEEPKQRANFYIAQKVGSTLETPEQLGLAHFLEHMAFNGTTHYPGKNLLDYLQSKGIRFGADINAYTAFDQTVYNIDNVPTTDAQLMDSVLLALRDWSCDILLAEDEIEAERGVIHSEWLQRNDANTRMLTAILPQIFDEYQYQQMPIGTMDVVLNFKPETLRAYYKKWYRPDQQGIVIVGDFDADAMEKKVIDMFSTVVMPENAAERTYPVVSDNVEPKVALFEDPELKVPVATISFKFDKVPAEFRNTVELYLQEDVLKDLFTMMINERLQEYSTRPECNYIQAGVYFGDFYVAKTKDSFNVACYAKGDVIKAMQDAISIVARACSTGFTDGELGRARDKMLSNIENAYAEREKTSSSSLAEELIDHFLDNDPMPGIEFEHMLLNQVLPTVPVQAFNELGAAIMQKENQVIVVAQPAGEGWQLPEKATVIETVAGALDATYEALEEQPITEPLISKLNKTGKIKSSAKDAELGLDILTLSNGVRVVIKPTDFSADQVLFTAYREGGKRAYAPAQAVDVNLMGDAFDYSKLGNYDVRTLQRYLAGKKIGLKYSVGNATNYLEGNSTVKDLPTLFELIYASFTAVGSDREMFDAMMDATKSMLANQQNDPGYIFSQHLNNARYAGNPMFATLTLADIDKANYDNMLALIKESTKNAADYTFIFTGNVDVETLRPLLEKYVASLPSSKKPSKVMDKSSIAGAMGIVTDEWNQPMQAPSVRVFDVYTGDQLPYDIENQVKLQLVGDVLDMIYTATLREEEGGTYGAQCGAQLNPNSGQWQVLYTFQTNAEQKDKLITRANDELLAMLANGANPEYFAKAREAALKQLEINERSNEYWNANLLTWCRGWNIISGHKAALENLTLDGFNSFMRDLYNGKNRIQVIMNGVEIK